MAELVGMICLAQFSSIASCDVLCCRCCCGCSLSWVTGLRATADVSFEGMMDILASTPRLFFGFLGLTPNGCSGTPCWLFGLEGLCLAAEACPLLKSLSSRYFSDKLPLF